jgi:hypothetical protein
MKVCKQCQIEKSLDDFSPKKASKDGRTYLCKVCCNQNQYLRKHNLKAPLTGRDYQSIIDARIDNEEDMKNDILRKLGYDLNSEISVHEQFMRRHYLVD